MYTWCFAHRENLIVECACDSSLELKKLLNILNDVALFVNGSYKRAEIYSETARSTPGIHALTKLKRIGKTRWSEKNDGIQNISKTTAHYFVLLKTLLLINQDSTIKKINREEAIYLNFF